MAGIKDKIVTVEHLDTLHKYNESSYMLNIDPTGTGTLTIDAIKMGDATLKYLSEGLLEISFTDEEVDESQSSNE